MALHPPFAQFNSNNGFLFIAFLVLINTELPLSLRGVWSDNHCVSKRSFGERNHRRVLRWTLCLILTYSNNNFFCRTLEMSFGITWSTRRPWRQLERIPVIRSMWPQKLVNTSQAGPFCFGAYLLVCLVDGHRFCLGERYSMWLDKSSNHHPQREHAGHSCFQGCCFVWAMWLLCGIILCWPLNWYN